MDVALSSTPSLDNLEEASMEEEGTKRIVDEESGMLDVLLSVTGERKICDGEKLCDGETLCDDASVMNESSEGVGSVSDVGSATAVTVNKKHRLVEVFHKVSRCCVRLQNGTCIKMHCQCRNKYEYDHLPTTSFGSIEVSVGIGLDKCE